MLRHVKLTKNDSVQLGKLKDEREEMESKLLSENVWAANSLIQLSQQNFTSISGTSKYNYNRCWGFMNKKF